MPFTWQITISKAPGGSGYMYAPATLASVGVADEVTWRNDDDVPHWPGAPAASGVPANPTLYMPYQIAPRSSSTTFVAGVADTLVYADSLDKSPSPPRGTIIVTGGGGSRPALIASK